MDIVLVSTAVGAAVIRNLAGWLEKSLADGSISKYEWAKLAETTLRIVIVTFAAKFGLDLDAISAAGGAILFDFIIKALK